MYLKKRQTSSVVDLRLELYTVFSLSRLYVLFLLASGYISEDESEGGESDVVLVEDYSALEEEGVTGLTRGKYALREVHMGFKWRAC